MGAGRARSPVPNEHVVLQLQRLAGNRAVSSLVNVQRRLKVTGAAKDVGEMLGLLGPGSGLTLKHNAKSKIVSGTASKTKPVSPELAGQLQTVIDDKKRDAEVNLGRKKKGITFGAFPDDVVNKPVQELRIDHFTAVEKGAPGSGVVKLAHEIIENYEAHGPARDDPRFAFTSSHEVALKVEDKILAELQSAGGQKLSGARRNTYKFVTGTGKDRKYQWVEAYENDYLVWEEVMNDKAAFSNARRVGKVHVRSFTVKGFSSTVHLPKDIDSTLQALADLLKKDSSASVVFLGTATDAKVAREVPKWGLKLEDRIIELIGAGDELTAASGRFHKAPASVGGSNQVVITVNRPDL